MTSEQPPGPPPSEQPPGSPPSEQPPAPPPPPPDPLAAPQRLHRAEIVLAGLDNLQQILIGVVVAVFAGSGTRAIIGIGIAAGGAVIAIVAGYVSWQYTTYFVRGGALHFRSGVFSPDETSIPLGRIQAIDESQGPIQRLFGVQELNVQTAGGGAKGEIVLRAVSEEAARALRAAAGLPEPVERDLPEWRLGMGALAVTAITAPQLSVLLPIVGAIGAGADDIFFPNDDGSGLIDALPRDAGGIEVLLGLLLLGALLLSFLGAIVTFSGFTLVRDGERLRIRRGLFARRAATIPLSRVHAVDVVEGVLRRPFGLCTVRVQTAGYAKERAAAQTLLPLVRVSDVQRLLDVFVPRLAGEVPELARPPARARRRYALPPAAVGVAVGVGATIAEPAAWPAIPVLGALGAVIGLMRWRAAGWSSDGRRFLVRGGALARRTLVARADRLQEHQLSANTFQRRAGLADFAASVGSGRTGGIRHLEAAVAGGLFERLRPRAGEP